MDDGYHEKEFCLMFESDENSSIKLSKKGRERTGNRQKGDNCEQSRLHREKRETHPKKEVSSSSHNCQTDNRKLSEETAIKSRRESNDNRRERKTLIKVKEIHHQTNK